MSDTIQWARLQDITPVVLALSWPENRSYMCLERIPEAWMTNEELQNDLRLEKPSLTENWNAWERGRLFCETFELRWERQDGVFQAVYVGPPTDLPDFVPADLDLSDKIVQEHSYYLWGKWVPDDQLQTVGAQEQEGQRVFLEFKIPRLLYYPVSDATQRVKLRVCEYVDPSSDQMVYYRFRGLEEVK